MQKKHICILVPVYNELDNIEELYARLTSVMGTLTQYTYEIRVIDNCSTDGTREKIQEICAKDNRFKAIFNIRNFGATRSPIHNLYNADGDAAISLCADLQDPPELIVQFLEKWEAGYKLVMGVRTSTQERGLYPFLRALFYNSLKFLSDAEQLPYSTGFGLYDKEVIATLRHLDDPYPFLRGLICELGWPIAKIPFDRPERKHGISSYNFLRYMEEGMLGIVSQSRVPLHLVLLIGGALTAGGIFSGLLYGLTALAGKGSTAFFLLIAMMFFSGLIITALGLIGEYISYITVQIVHRPLVIEEKRINFDTPSRSMENPAQYEKHRGEPS